MFKNNIVADAIKLLSTSYICFVKAIFFNRISPLYFALPDIRSFWPFRMTRKYIFIFYMLCFILSVQIQITASAASAAGASEAPVYGDQIILGLSGEPSNLLPFIASDAPSHEVSSLLFVAPLKYDKDLKIIPWAAESFEVLEDGKLLSFVLRKGIKWEDGTELTADDVEFTYKLMVDPQTPTPYAEDFLVISEFKKTGPYSFEVRYDKPFARSLITWMSSIMPKHLLEYTPADPPVKTVGGDASESDSATNKELMEAQAAKRAKSLEKKYASFGRSPKGSGPFIMKNWESGSRLRLDSNHEYFEGRTYLDGVVYRVIPDLSAMFLELKAKKLDMMNLTPLQYLYQTSGTDWEQRYNKFKYVSFGYTFLGYNLKNPLFEDVRVRQAVALAINKQDLVAGVLLGQGMPTIGPYKPGTWVYNDKIEDYAYDPEQALKLLAEAGWRDTNNDGLLEKNGKRFSFTILLNQGNEQRIKTATIIQSQLKQIGMEVKIRTVEWAAFIKDFVNKGRFDCLVLGWNILQDPDIYNVWHSSQTKEGGLNFVGYKNPEVDDLLERGRRSLDQAERKVIYDRFQEILHHDQPYCFLYVPYSLPIIDARFKGIEPAPAGITHNFNQWWVPKNMHMYTMQP